MSAKYGVTAADAVESLTEFIDWLKANQEAIEAAGLTFSIDLSDYSANDGERLAAWAQLPGRWDKRVTDEFFNLDRDFGKLTFSAVAYRQQVCTAVPTGKKTTRQVEVQPAVYEDVEEDEVEWVCEPLLSKANAA